EERRLSGIRISDQGHGRDRRRLAPLALLAADAPDGLDLLLYISYAPRDLSTVGFELRFTGTARADAAAELRHLNAMSSQARQHVLQLRELDLQLAFAGARLARKNVEDELGAVDPPPLDNLLNIALLGRA